MFFLNTHYLWNEVGDSLFKLVCITDIANSLFSSKLVSTVEEFMLFTVKPDVLLRATLQTSAATLVFWLTVCFEQVGCNFREQVPISNLLSFAGFLNWKYLVWLPCSITILDTVCLDNPTMPVICSCFTPDDHKAIILSLYSQPR